MNIYFYYTSFKKLGSCFLLAAVIFSACKKDDSHLFSESPDQRLNEALAKYQTQLSGAKDGWKGIIYPASGGVFTFYFKFNDANRVQMLSGFDSLSAVTLAESSYRLKALQQPSLLFDTYSYLHVLSDPDPSVNGGTTGAGLSSDFEFYFDSTATDTIKLVGRQNGSKLTLVRATNSEATALLGGQLANGFLINKIITYFKRLRVGTQSADININRTGRTIAAVDANGDLLDSTRITPYYISLDGITFQKPLLIGNLTISTISGLSWNAAGGTLTCLVNNTAATILPVTIPLKVDVTAPKRWWNDKASTQDYWFSINGFHDNGRDDADRIDTVTSNGSRYYFLIYYPAYEPGNDLFAPIFLNTSANSLSLVYGNAPSTPRYTSDGRAVFSLLNNYGTYPSTGAAAITSNRLFKTSGYYFVQTSASTYDMVSAADGKSWVNWQ